MGTSRKIYEESAQLCRRENNFVCVTFTQPSSLGRRLQWHGMKMIACGAEAHDFPYVAMTLTLDSSHFVFWDVDPEQSCEYIFCIEEMPTFCRLLSKLQKRYPHPPLRRPSIFVNVSATWRDVQWEMDCSAAGLLRLQKLLGPLRQLHIFGTAQIEGPISDSYKSDVIASLCKNPPTATELIQTVMMCSSEADELLGQGFAIDAIGKYKSALNCVRSSRWRHDFRRFAVDSGSLAGLSAEQPICSLKVRLLARIALTYFDSGRMRMARIYVARAIGSYSVLFGYAKLRKLGYRPWEPDVFAEVLHVSAQIWYACGHVEDAVGDLCRARGYVELNEEQQRRLEVWQKQNSRLRERREKKAKSRDLQLQQEARKVESMRS